jgi:hypothetical protein
MQVAPVASKHWSGVRQTVVYGGAFLIGVITAGIWEHLGFGAALGLAAAFIALTFAIPIQQQKIVWRVVLAYGIGAVLMFWLEQQSWHEPIMEWVLNKPEE